MHELVVVGGGLAGCEAAWQAAQRGIQVVLYEMRPVVQTGAHTGSDLAELVCSNSLGSRLVDRATGQLAEESRRMGSLLLQCADETSVPAGGALAVDRHAFAQRVTEMISAHPRIRLVRQELQEIPVDQPVVVASGPLTSPALSQAIAALTGQDHLYFYDAIAPVVLLDSIDMDIAFRASRYSRGVQEEGDYLNCPLNQDEYAAFITALVEAERIELKEFESELEQGVQAGARHFFESCLPIEVLARRESHALAFGPMRPVGLTDPRSGRWPHAVLQLRQDNLAGTLYNLVGFQTNLKFSEQRRVFRMIPGLEHVEFVRYGQMHRNTFIFSPQHLLPTLQFRSRSDLFFAGQITGVEGYVGNIATGLLAGWNAARLMLGQAPLEFPVLTLLGALCHYITHAGPADFQPMKANFGLLPPLGDEYRRSGRRERGAVQGRRARAGLDDFLRQVDVLPAANVVVADKGLVGIPAAGLPARGVHSSEVQQA